MKTPYLRILTLDHPEQEIIVKLVPTDRAYMQGTTMHAGYAISPTSEQAMDITNSKNKQGAWFSPKRQQAASFVWECIHISRYKGDSKWGHLVCEPDDELQHRPLIWEYVGEVEENTPTPVLPLPDLAAVIAAVQAHGFQAPAVSYFKNDPRGSEYGVWKVDICDTDNIKVTHSRDKYTMRFDGVANFKAWASSAS